MEPFYPLQALVCSSCFLVQLQQFESPENIFSDYAYFSSFSESWLSHAREYATQVIERFGLNEQSSVVELASNDGYLLQYFKQRDVAILGVEPAANVAQVAIDKDIPTCIGFFGTNLAQKLVAESKHADLLVGNNVLAHVPDLNDFVLGMKMLLKPEGVITMEFPHLMRLMEQTQFDTIYHEHFSYFSLHTVQRIFSHHGLKLFDVDELPTHGGSLRIYSCHESSTKYPVSERLLQVEQNEIDARMFQLDYYISFEEKVRTLKRDLLAFLIEAKRNGKQVVGYGAPAKGNTLLNYCGIGLDFIDYTVDLSPYKQGHFLPGSHIPIFPPAKINETQPDYLLLLPWNLKQEIMGQMAHIRDWGGKFVIPIPHVEVI